MRFLLLAILLLVPTLAEACDRHRSKTTTCSSYTYGIGTTKTACRSR